MSKDSDSKSNPPQDTADKPTASKATASGKKPRHLQLVVSNPPVNMNVQEEDPLKPSKKPLPATDFSVKLNKLGGVYKMVIHDHFHDLKCEFHLEVEKQKQGKAVICHLPNMMDTANKFLEEDESLYGVIAVQFQLKALKHFFLFCRKFRVSKLVLYIDNEDSQNFEVYHNFLASYSDALIMDSKVTQMVIPTHRYAFFFLRGFIQESSHKMEQGLWRDQRTNVAIREYLKARIQQRWLPTTQE